MTCSRRQEQGPCGHERARHRVAPGVSSCCPSVSSAAPDSGEPARRAAYSAAPAAGGNRGARYSSRSRCRGEAGAERVHHRRRVVEHAAAVRHGHGFVRRHAERAVRRDDAVDELARAAREDRGGFGITGPGRLVHETGELRERVAAVRARAVNARAQVQVVLEAEAFTHQPMERAARGAPVAHAREQVHALARDPVGRALVADQLAPAAAARLATRVLAVSHRAGARDDADPVGAGRASPAQLQTMSLPQ